MTSLQRGTLRLTRLIDNLLESVRIESGQLGIRQQSIHLGDVVSDATDLIGSLLPQRGQWLEVNVPEDLPPITGDAPRLVQVFVNLLANANKFGPEGSVIRVGAVSRGDSIEAWVEDEGPGMADDDAAARFSTVSTVRRTRSRNRAGSASASGSSSRSSNATAARVTADRTEDGRTRFSLTLPAGDKSQ